MALAAGGDSLMLVTMRSRASSHVPRRNGSARRSRASGWSRRAGLSNISREACPRMQRNPWLSGLASSPETLTSLPSLTSASMPHSVGWQLIGHIVRTILVAMSSIRGSLQAAGEVTNDASVSYCQEPINCPNLRNRSNDVAGTDLRAGVCNGVVDLRGMGHHVRTAHPFHHHPRDQPT